MLLPEPAALPPELPELPALDAPPERSVLLAELPPEALPASRGYQYRHSPEDLLRTMAAVLERGENRLPPPMAAFTGIVGREPYPVSDKAQEILRQLEHYGVTRFQALFRGNRSRSEVVATFIAVLELCKARRLRLAGTAADCTVTCTGGEEGQALDFSTDE